MKLTNVSAKEYTDKTIAKLQYENKTIENKIFEECTFNKCNFISCKLKNCTFLECTFEDCVLSATVPLNSRFIDVVFKKSKVIGIDWTKAKELRNLSFINSAIDYCNFRFLDINSIIILDSTAIETDFTEATMKKANLKGTDFKGAVFNKTNLIEANFKSSTNYNIDIKANKLKRAQFSFPEAINLLAGLDIEVEY